MVLIGFIIGAVFVLVLTNTRRSKHYRKVLADLFVAGRIRQIAEEKSVDLGQEYDDYKSFRKGRDISRQTLDESIEQNLQEEIAEDEELF